MTKKTQGELEPIYNERGVIAQFYSELQAEHIINATKEAYPLPQASDESTLRAIFQSVEIALLNIEDLVSRMTIEIEQQRFASAVVKMMWVRGFHYVLTQLSTMPEMLGIVLGSKGSNSELKITDSPAFHKYNNTLRHFDQSVLGAIKSGEIPIETLLEQKTLDNNQLHLIHLARLCNHETTFWERNLSKVLVPVAVPSYEEFVGAQGMHNAVYDTTLKGDTFYLQFRGLHQIAEILCAEINDHIVCSILQIRANSLQRAHEHLRYIDVLSEGILASLSPMVDSLANADYYIFRENLGLTSGNHSINMHYHLFRDLYKQLWDAFEKYLLQEVGTSDKKGMQEKIRQTDLMRFENTESFLIYLVSNEMLKLRAFTNEWREGHLHLPRNNVGSDTRSLMGSRDAIQAVKKLRDIALLKDPMEPLLKARALENAHLDTEDTPLMTYFDKPSSLDWKILDVTGEITRRLFEHVQERTGIFAGRIPFAQPPKREV